MQWTSSYFSFLSSKKFTGSCPNFSKQLVCRLCEQMTCTLRLCLNCFLFLSVYTVVVFCVIYVHDLTGSVNFSRIGDQWGHLEFLSGTGVPKGTAFFCTSFNHISMHNLSRICFFFLLFCQTTDDVAMLTCCYGNGCYGIPHFCLGCYQGQWVCHRKVLLLIASRRVGKLKFIFLCKED